MVPLVLDSPHSGHDFPADFGAIVSEAELRESEDCYVDELYAAAHELGVPLLAATFPRTYLDPNRHAGDVDLELLDGPWPWEYRPSGKARIGKSLIWRTLEDGRPIYGRRLKPEAVRRRIDRVHAPYHRSLQEMLDAAVKKSGKVYHINCHSMRCVAGRQSDDGAGSVRPDFVLGDRDGTTCDPAFTELVRETLAGMGYDVKVNDPYKGVELVRAYSNPRAGRHSLQIEINKRLYMNEKTLEKSAGFARLQSNLGELLRAVVDEISD
ncbi:MAG TPA: N-formylglutamate amidohydrolase [Burkholderiales bacterium]|nr:N-formylglutamate amidohydrolase [Burkholderiales bacterium]